MKALQYNRRSTEKLVLKGTIKNENGNYLISYPTDNEGMKEVPISDVLGIFSGLDVAITIALNTDVDLLDDGNLPDYVERDTIVSGDDEEYES